MSGLRVLVTGGRDYADAETVARALAWARGEFGIACLIHGGAKGADTLAAEWARTNGVPAIAVYANWARDGKAAGPIRNADMLRLHAPEFVVAFPGGRGTADMVRRARHFGLPIHFAAPPNPELPDTDASRAGVVVDRSRSTPNASAVSTYTVTPPSRRPE